MGRDRGVLLAEAAGGRVSGVGEDALARAVALLVEADEAALGHVDLAADLDGAAEATPGDALEAGAGERARDVGDREGVGRDVLAGGAVAAGRSAHEAAVAVRERDAEAVDLELAGVGDGVGLARAERLVGAGEPLVELGEVHGVVHGVHAAGVGDLLELAREVAAHAVRVGRRVVELGVGRLEGDELLQVEVELRVGDLGVVERVVAVRVVVEQAAKLRDARGRLGGARVGRALGLGHGRGRGGALLGGRRRGRRGRGLEAVPEEGKLLRLVGGVVWHRCSHRCLNINRSATRRAREGGAGVRRGSTRRR